MYLFFFFFFKLTPRIQNITVFSRGKKTNLRSILSSQRSIVLLQLKKKIKIKIHLHFNTNKAKEKAKESRSATARSDVSDVGLSAAAAVIPQLRSLKHANIFLRRSFPPVFGASLSVSSFAFEAPGERRRSTGSRPPRVEPHAEWGRGTNREP